MTFQRRIYVYKENIHVCIYVHTPYVCIYMFRYCRHTTFQRIHMYAQRIFTCEYMYTHHMCAYIDMGWLRLVGSLKLQVSFAEYRLFYRALLQKRPMILRSLLIEATPYMHLWALFTHDVLETLICLSYRIHIYEYMCGCHKLFDCTYVFWMCGCHELIGSTYMKKNTYVQPIADRVAQHLELISKNFQFSTRRTRILMGFIIYYLVLIVNPMGRILVR